MTENEKALLENALKMAKNVIDMLHESGLDKADYTYDTLTSLTNKLRKDGYLNEKEDK